MEHPREDPYRGAGPTVRRLLLGSGPLKRGTDRAELLLRVLTLGALLLLAPAGMAVGSTVHGHMHVEADRQLAEYTEVQARLLTEPVADAGQLSTDLVRVEARWYTPGGERREGTVPVGQQAEVGDRVQVWIDRAGERQIAPLTDRQIAVQSVTVGILTMGLAGLTLLAAHAGCVWQLNRRRARSWSLGWAAVEPVWRREVLR